VATHPPPKPPLAYPLGAPPLPRGLHRKSPPGIHWLRMPLPMSLDHNQPVGAGGTAKAGPSSDNRHAPPTKSPSRLAETSCPGLMARPAPVKRVICTHMHPDHIGMAGWLNRGDLTAGSGFPAWE